MIYLRKFENHAAYTAAESGLILPNVSLCVNENDVHYNPIPDPYAGHAYVEIGGLKWATMNVGASSVTDYGLFFQWGDTQGYTAAQVGSGEGKKYFGWADYKYTNDGGSTMSKYNGSDYTVLQAEDDAVTAAWGGNWRMPTTEEYAALGAVCSTAWTTTYEGSASGMLLTVTADTADNGKQLFFPAAGYCYNSRVVSVGSYGYYWSSSLYTSNVRYAYNLSFLSGYVYWQYSLLRYNGYTVRPVAR